MTIDLIDLIRDIASFKLEDAIDARREMDGDRYKDFEAEEAKREDYYDGLDEERRLGHRQSEADEHRYHDDRERAADINTERRLMGLE